MTKTVFISAVNGTAMRVLLYIDIVDECDGCNGGQLLLRLWFVAPPLRTMVMSDW
jgi:hypothetical protein